MKRLSRMLVLLPLLLAMTACAGETRTVTLRVHGDLTEAYGTEDVLFTVELAAEGQDGSYRQVTLRDGESTTLTIGGGPVYIREIEGDKPIYPGYAVEPTYYADDEAQALHVVVGRPRYLSTEAIEMTGDFDLLPEGTASLGTLEGYIGGEMVNSLALYPTVDGQEGFYLLSVGQEIRIADGPDIPGFGVTVTSDPPAPFVMEPGTEPRIFINIKKLGTP